MRFGNWRGTPLAFGLVLAVATAFGSSAWGHPFRHTIPRLVPAQDVNTGGPYYMPPIPYGHYAGKDCIGKMQKCLGRLCGVCGGLGCGLCGGTGCGNGCGRNACGACGGVGCGLCGGKGLGSGCGFCGGKGCGVCGGGGCGGGGGLGHGHGHGIGACSSCGGGGCGACRNQIAPMGTAVIGGTYAAGSVVLPGHATTGPEATPQAAPQAAVPFVTGTACGGCGGKGCGLCKGHRRGRGGLCSACGGRGCGLCGGHGGMGDPGRGHGLCSNCGGRGCGKCHNKKLCQNCGGRGCALCRGLWAKLMHWNRAEYFVGPGGPVPITPGYVPYVVVTRSPRDYFAFPPFSDLDP